MIWLCWQWIVVRVVSKWIVRASTLFLDFLWFIIWIICEWVVITIGDILIRVHHIFTTLVIVQVTISSGCSEMVTANLVVVSHNGLGRDTSVANLDHTLTAVHHVMLTEQVLVIQLRHGRYQRVFLLLWLLLCLSWLALLLCWFCCWCWCSWS